MKEHLAFKTFVDGQTYAVCGKKNVKTSYRPTCKACTKWLSRHKATPDY